MTAVIQSSSATIIMVIGFLNAGILKLVQAVPVIMGSQYRYHSYGPDRFVWETSTTRT